MPAAVFEQLTMLGLLFSTVFVVFGNVWQQLYWKKLESFFKINQFLILHVVLIP